MFLDFKVSRYIEGYSLVIEDLKFKISEGSDQSWLCPVGCLSLTETANRAAEPGQLQFLSEPSEILNLRSSNTPETVALTQP